MELIPIQMPLIQQGDDIVASFLDALHGKGLDLADGDVVAFADKIAAISEGRVIDLDHVAPSDEAKALAERYALEPAFVEVVLQEADEVFGGVARALLTVKNEVLIANAGMDHKNAPPHSATLWPSKPNETAATLRGKVERATGKRVGVLLVDSHVAPMRMGTLGFALGIAGFRPVKDCRGMKDLYGKPLLITRMNVADDLAAAAHLIMGETTERIACVLLRHTDVPITDDFDPREVIIPKDECLFMKNLGRARSTP
jgi:coenzyme F420-0:L-glutamate ligase/coenzyme F420-1:gamma-L-glutamate ligase